MALFHKKNSYSIELLAFLQALGVILYCGLVWTILYNAGRLFQKMDSTVGPFIFLTLFSTSVLICGILVFGKPFLLYFEENRKKDAVKLVLGTAAWLSLITSLILATFVAI